METLGTASADMIFKNEKGSGWIRLGENKYLVEVLKKYTITQEGEISTIYEGNLIENTGKVRFALYKDVMVGEIELIGITYSFGIAQSLESGIFLLDQYNEHLQEIGLEEGIIEPPPFLDVYVPADKIPAEIDFDPDTLNLKSDKSEDKWVTVYIELLAGYDVSSIDITTIRLNESVPAESDPKYGFVKNPDSYLVDHDNDGLLERMVKFNRTDVQNILEPSDRVKIEITGSLFDGRPFYGLDWIRVIGEKELITPDFMSNSTVENLTIDQEECLSCPGEGVEENPCTENSFTRWIKLYPSKTELEPGEPFDLRIDWYRTCWCPSDYFKVLIKNEKTGEIEEKTRFAHPYWEMCSSYCTESRTKSLSAPTEPGIYTIKVVHASGHGESWCGYYSVNWNCPRSDGGFRGHSPEELSWNFYEIAAEFRITVIPKERIVSVYAAADEEYIDYYDDWWNPWDQEQWKSEIRKAVELGDNAFEKEFKINFIITDIGTWDSTDGVHDYAKLWDEAWREIDKGTNDIKVAFTGQEMRKGKHKVLGAAMYDTVIVNPVRNVFVDNLHQHEYSHLFGAPDHTDPAIKCIMTYNSEDWVWKINTWCSSCHSTIKENKWKQF